MSTSALFLALQALGISAATAAAYAAYLLFVLPLTSPLRLLPGPRFKGLFSHDHMKWLLHGERSASIGEQLIAAHGRNFRIQGLGPWDDRLFTLDPVAVSHIMNRPQDYHKPWQSRRLISSLIGDGLLSSEGQQHKMQRRVLNPTFSVQNLRALAPVLLAKAEELRDKWLAIVTSDTAPEKIDPNHWFGRATFDIIGLAGFDYDFGAIQNESNEVYLAYRDMFEVAINGGQSYRSIAGIYFPILDKLLPDHRTRVVAKSRKIIDELGARMITEKKAAIAAGGSAVGKDLLTLLLKSQIAKSTPSDQQISEEDMVNQINTFLFAGSDTTALAMTWILYHLTQTSECQHRLREELSGVQIPEDPQELFQELDQLRYLDNVVREGLRLVSPVHSTLRVANNDDDIPVSEPIKLRNGRVVRSVRIRKGQIVHIPMEGFNLDRNIWGSDAWSFNPDRWDQVPESTNVLPGIYAKTMTFSMGPRACIGLRLSLMEIKIFLFILLTRFEFRDSDTVYKSNVVLTRPYVRGKPGLGSQCPMRIVPLPGRNS
ncbi:cytochrome-450 hydroxylase [Auriculariales sp. MPI-PUGE-AT-0066]|nr:cytochrome-450 hydroxylase [Auriculariales sp. MPI-PUGE-AT-0066]